MTWLTLILAVLAFGCLGSATDDHQQRLTGRRLASATKAGWRAGAWVALAVAFGSAVAARGWVFGPVLWCGVVMLAAGIVFVALNFMPRRTSPQGE